MLEKEINFFIKEVLELPSQVKIDRSFKHIQNIIFPENDYKILDVYGKGQYGLVLKIKSNMDNNIYALKLLNTSSFSEEEFKIQQIFADYDMSPKIYKYEHVQMTDNGAKIDFMKAIMEPIYTTVNKYLKDKNNPENLFEPFACLIKKKYLLNYPYSILHSDMHSDNIVILNDKKTLGFIDFGMSKIKPCGLQILDCIPLISSLKLSTPRYSRSLCEYLIDFYNDMFNVNLNYNKFVMHPGGGCAYYDKGIYLHSYSWEPCKNRNPLPTLNEIKRVFPSFIPPKVK